jgi:hypothetical protein
VNTLTPVALIIAGDVIETEELRVADDLLAGYPVARLALFPVADDGAFP